jgi:hypothetical protein
VLHWLETNLDFALEENRVAAKEAAEKALPFYQSL